MEPLNMPLEEAMRTQRAIRRLKPDPMVSLDRYGNRAFLGRRGESS